MTVENPDDLWCVACSTHIEETDVAPCGEALCDRHDPCDCPLCHAIYSEVCS